MKKWLCVVCGWIYDEAKGWPADGIAPGTKWEDIPEDWVCPECLVSKSDFEMIEITEEVVEDTTDITQSDVATGPVVIIGSGHAGYQLAATLRDYSSDIPIVIFTADAGYLYSKPALSNAFTLGKDSDALKRESALDIEKNLNIRVYPHTKVEKINRIHKRIETNIGTFDYGHLVLAVGASPIHVPVDGDKTAVCSVNNLEDYRYFRERLKNKKHITILGDGLIGCEFANDLAASGIKVTVVGLGAWVMSKLIPIELGVALQHSLSALGVEWKLQNSIQSVHVADGGYEVTLQDGQRFKTDVVLSAVGLRPDIKLAKEAGLDTNLGIQTGLDHRTNDDAIFALGDCAEVAGHWLPYIQPINQAIPTIVDNLLGKKTKTDLERAPIMVKTSALPLSVMPPLGSGQWQVESVDVHNWVASFYSTAGVLEGFALLGEQVQKERQEWVKKINCKFVA